MSRPFRPYEPSQTFLLPPDLRDWLPEDHLSFYIDDLVKDLDLSAIFAYYDNDGRGCVPYDPRMMIRIILYGYAIGVTSSRKLEQKVVEDIAFRCLAAGNRPDFHTINAFRLRHREALQQLFYQVLDLARRAGLVRLGLVALDGTKVKANAAKENTFSKDRLDKEDQRLQDDIKRYLDEAEKIDKEEDATFGDGNGFSLPEGLRSRRERLERIREAKKQIEEDKKRQLDERDAEDKAAAEERARKEAEEAAKGKKLRGRRPKQPDEKQRQLRQAQRNTTDPDSRIMETRHGFEQSYNVQLVVDTDDQMIVAVAVTQEVTDKLQLVPMLERMEATVGLPDALVVDAGYYGQEAVRWASAKTDLYISTQSRLRELPEGWGEGPPPLCLSFKGAMSWKVASPAGRAKYRKRGCSVEPINGQIKDRQGFRQFLMRGLKKVTLEAHLVAIGSNLKKMWRRAAPAIEKDGKAPKISKIRRNTTRT
jgi:transposase